MTTTLEGATSVLAALRARRRRIEVVLVKRDAPGDKSKDVLTTAEEMGVPVRLVEGAELVKVAHGVTHGGVVAICQPLPRLDGRQLFDLLDGLKQPPLLLLLEGVDDARNLGFTIRSAEALGVTAVLIKKHLWDFDETEITRPASGAYERLPLVQFEDVAVLTGLQQRGVLLYGCLAGVKRSLFETDLTVPVCLAIGGEKRGLSGAVRNVCDQFVTIPSLEGAASSLSLSHAGAIVMGEAFRQRISDAFPPSGGRRLG